MKRPALSQSRAEKQHQSGVLQVKIDVDRVGVKRPAASNAPINAKKQATCAHTPPPARWHHRTENVREHQEPSTTALKENEVHEKKVHKGVEALQVQGFGSGCSSRIQAAEGPRTQEEVAACQLKGGVTKPYKCSKCGQPKKGHMQEESP